MTVFDPYWKAVEGAAAVRNGRPPHSPGWGMLRAVKTGVFTSKQGERITVYAAVTGVAPSHWLARERPELFAAADTRDARTAREHRANLERTRQELGRGRPTGRPSRPKGVLAPKGVLPPKASVPATAPGDPHPRAAMSDFNPGGGWFF